MISDNSNHSIALPVQQMIMMTTENPVSRDMPVQRSERDLSLRRFEFQSSSAEDTAITANSTMLIPLRLVGYLYYFASSLIIPIVVTYVHFAVIQILRLSHSGSKCAYNLNGRVLCKVCHARRPSPRTDRFSTSPNLLTAQ